MNSIKGAEPQIKNLIDRMKKNKEEHKNPMKIFSKEEEKNDDRPIPGKLGPPELSKEKKNHGKNDISKTESSKEWSIPRYH